MSGAIGRYDVTMVDTTGVGDNFTAGFLTEIISGWDLKKCGLFADPVGSICMRQAGVTASGRNMEQVLQFMKANRISVT